MNTSNIIYEPSLAGYLLGMGEVQDLTLKRALSKLHASQPPKPEPEQEIKHARPKNPKGVKYAYWKPTVQKLNVCIPRHVNGKVNQTHVGYADNYEEAEKIQRQHGYLQF